MCGYSGFKGDDRFSFMVVDNLTNLFNDDWGEQHNFPATVVRGTKEPRIGDASRYEVVLVSSTLSNF
jgi:hypothetical protein